MIHGKSFAAVSFTWVEQATCFDALAFIVVISPTATTTHSEPTSLKRCAMSPHLQRAEPKQYLPRPGRVCAMLRGLNREDK